MYTVRVVTHNDFEKKVAFFNRQNATKYALSIMDCIDIALIDIINEETGEVGLTIENGKVTWIGVIDF